ncbi:ligase-associated DNA damage response endonuclease PdeM [Sphingobacterium sp. DR205]|uniref:ligase-associated DNA damage response endonuclease PdeM n=1 Tax=Sphingobacterium sp. DR205 TaxID=2713573 RepID=UPI0013E4C911|nr:ligase-associated DNA damage response endonuclease PdeM [Sphingobacterium sp. DR205]QIH34385.1 ligase-associated DNA damage response endonuclease PdeM [Sphingobacterium sp. DR205]
MNIQEQHITFNKQTLILNNQRTIFWPKQNTLILSDLHLGKAAHFRKHGIPIPSDTSSRDLDRLAALIDHYRAENVLVVGDLIHAGINQEVLLLAAFKQRYADLNFHLVVGNHDRKVEKLAEQVDLIYHHDKFELEQISFVHEPIIDPSAFTISGHIHPGIRIKLPPNKHLRLPCFWVSTQQIILPAFSKFTGLDSRRMPQEYDCYALHDEIILPLKNS